jgi:ATP-dependent DNA helicase RecQ
MDKLSILKKHFGYTSFRTGQELLIDRILAGRDVLGIMPTGGGKSLCYQLPALLKEGTAIVVSPLISLMKDQVDGLVENGVSCTYINSSLTGAELSARLRDLEKGVFKLAYVAPERLNTWEFVEIAKSINISLIAVDEAHCISQWGHDFRPSYKEIPKFIDRLPTRPCVAAFTATATQFVKEEIKTLLALRAPFEVATGFDRPNLFYSVAKPQNKLKFVADYLKRFEDEASDGSGALQTTHPSRSSRSAQGIGRERRFNASGIIFCATRKTVDSLTKALQDQGYPAEAYHAGYESAQRKTVQENFMFDRTKIIVATNAFGMGIDKPDVRFVIHYNMPKNMEAYYQEAGRAGRDGEDSDCILMYSPADVVRQKLLMASADSAGSGGLSGSLGLTDALGEFDMNDLSVSASVSEAERETMMHENLQTLVNYCHTHECLRGEILKYFGEMPEQETCAKCGNCLNESKMVDMTLEAQKILSCIFRTNQRFGSGTIIKVLRGSKDKKILDWQLDKQSTYGIMGESSENLIKEIIMHLLAQGYLQTSGGEYPLLALSPTSKQLLKGETQFFVRQDRLDASTVSRKEKPDRTKGRGKGSGTGTTALTEAEGDLYDHLVALRRRLADEKSLPAYIIFGNATLADMAALKPQTKEEMLEVKGVGEKKFETYGHIFLEAIRGFGTKG